MGGIFFFFRFLKKKITSQISNFIRENPFNFLKKCTKSKKNSDLKKKKKKIVQYTAAARFQPDVGPVLTSHPSVPGCVRKKQPVLIGKWLFLTGKTAILASILI
jgi:hypothetical protein